MITTIVSDFSRVILFPKDTTYSGDLNPLDGELKRKKEYNPLDYFVFNEEYLDLLSSLKNSYSLVIFTSGHMQEDPRLSSKILPIFEKIYTTSDTGFEKSDSRVYQKLAKLLSIQPEYMLFIDDNAENCSAAQKVGVATVRYIDNKSLVSELRRRKIV